MGDRLSGPGEGILSYRSAVDGTSQPYRLYLPRRPRLRYPVVVCLHGFGGRMSGWPASARQLADWLGLALLSPDGRGNQNWDGPGEDDVFAALDDAAREVRLDPDRIYLHGGSMGGHGALRLALRHPHRFAAVSAVAGWITAARYYRKWYAPPRQPEPPAILAPLVEAAAPWAWREHAQWVPGRLAYGTADEVNQPEDNDWLAAWLRHRGWYGRGGWTSQRVLDGGHGAGHDWGATLRFLARCRRTWPRRIRSLTLRHADVGWVRVDRAADPLAPIELDLAWRRGGCEITARNAAEVVVTPRLGPPCLRRGAVEVRVADQDGAAPQTFAVPRGEAATVALLQAGGPFTKRRGVCGPIGELFRARFAVVAPEGGPEHDAALRFCADWNAWLILRWSGDEPCPRPRPWWRPPYPWPPGAHVPAGTPWLAPLPPSAAPDDGHLMVFGDPEVCPLTRRFATWSGRLPFRPLAAGIEVDGREYTGERIGYLALHPAPWAPQRLMLLCRGWQNSDIDAATWPSRVLGKDLERLPWQWPDLVVWERGVVCRDTVQPPLRHLPDAWLLAATLDAAWGWSGAQVWRR